MWIVIAVVVLALVLLVAVTVPVVGRLSALQRAVLRLERRQGEATQLQEGAAELQETLAGLERRAETMQERLAVIQAGRGDQSGKHALPFGR
ncbi:hypothetical protein LDL48_42350 [Wangella sp. NEAU-J3]|nr:hypothetical protein [Jidongwangia harbinensis]MCA2219443.1 hypothetical protein [Jidongwangia harbinensis]